VSLVFGAWDDADWPSAGPAAPHVPKTAQQVALEHAEASALAAQMDAFLDQAMAKYAADYLWTCLNCGVNHYNKPHAEHCEWGRAADRERLIDEARD
jgi:hypothetical protein